MRFAKTLVAVGALCAVAGTAAAQQAGATGGGMPESYRQVQLNALALQRRVLLTMADSMPERLYHDKTTPIQRDFAQQIMHAASVWGFLPRLMGSGPVPATDTAAAHNTRAGLRAYINTMYDYADGVLRNQTADSRMQMTNLFGMQMQRWQVWDEFHQHTFWTAGQVVSNFRLNGMAPPGFGFF